MTGLMAPFTGGPGGKDPGHVSYGQVTLRTLVSDAYNVRNVFDILGPAWIDNVYWAVTATYSPNTTSSQYDEMVKNLLIERFHLQAHPEAKPISGIEMTVAPAGLKISPAKDSENFAVPIEGARPIDRDGFPLLRPDLMFAMTTGGDAIRMTFRQRTSAFLAGRCSMP